MRAIYKKELRAYFTAPLGYIFLAVFWITSGALLAYSTLLRPQSSSVATYFSMMLFAMVVLLPLLTMRSFSEERKLRTEQLLLTAPVSLYGMVVSKFLAAYTIFASTFVVASLNLLILTRYTEGLSAATMIGAVFALLLVGGAFLAIGIFISSLTESQLVAAIFTIFTLVALLAIGMFNAAINSYVLRSILGWISLFNRFSNFTKGIFDFAALLYYLSFTVVFLFLTVRVFERRRWS